MQLQKNMIDSATCEICTQEISAHCTLVVVNAPNPNSNGHIECMQRFEIEKSCLAEVGWFTQAGTMPFLIPHC